MPVVSIIVPVYKAEAYLRDCVDSILSQTFSDFEVFLVNDGSPDNCGAICEEYKEKDCRVRVIHQENQGQAAARNHALVQAAGSWICFVDSDDVIHPQMLELLYAAAESADASVSKCDMVEGVQIPGDFLRKRETSHEALAMDEETLVRLFDNEAYPSWVACAKLIRRELVEAYPFREGRVYEDNEAVCHWVCDAGKLAWVHEDMYYYRTNPVSTTQKDFSLKKQDYLWALGSIIRFYHSLGYNALTERFCDMYVEEFAGQYSRIYSEMNCPDILTEMKKSLKKMVRKDKIRLNKKQKELLLDAMHPKLIRYYWPLEGAVRTLREKGFNTLVQKVVENLRKEDRQ